MRLLITTIFCFCFVPLLFSSSNDTKNYNLDSFIKFDTSKYKFSSQLSGQVSRDLKLLELKFKVKDVKSTSKEFAIIAFKFKGYISKDNLDKRVTGIDKTKISEDSIALVSNFFYTNTVLIRIPHHLLDSALSEIKAQIEYPSFQTSMVNDSLYQKLLVDSQYFRQNNYQSNTSIKGSKAEVMDGIIVTIYDNPNFSINHIKIPKEIEPQRLGFIDYISKSIIGGYYLMTDLIGVVAYFWFLIVALIVGIYGYHKFNTSEN